MILTIIDKTEEDGSSYPSLEIKGEDSESVVSCFFQEGEPEDRTMYRDFNGVFSIKNLVKMAYEAGKRGEDLEIVKA